MSLSGNYTKAIRKLEGLISGKKSYQDVTCMSADVGALCLGMGFDNLPVLYHVTDFKSLFVDAEDRDARELLSYLVMEASKNKAVKFGVHVLTSSPKYWGNLPVNILPSYDESSDDYIRYLCDPAQQKNRGRIQLFIIDNTKNIPKLYKDVQDLVKWMIESGHKHDIFVVGSGNVFSDGFEEIVHFDGKDFFVGVGGVNLPFYIPSMG